MTMHMNRIILGTLFLFFGMFACLEAQRITTRDVLRWQDERGPIDSLITALEHPAPEVRILALRGIANIQDSSAVLAIGAQISDKNSGVRRMAAFALGQIPCALSELMLFSALDREKNPIVQRQLLVSIGNISWGEALDVLLPRLALGTKEGSRDFANTFLRFAVRGQATSGAIEESFRLLAKSDSETQWRLIYALWRCSPSSAVDTSITKYVKLLKQLTTDASSDVRMNMATLLGRSQASVSVKLLAGMLEQEMKRKRTDWRVQVMLVRAGVSRALSNRQLLPAVLPYSFSVHQHVKIALIQALSSAPAALSIDSSISAALQSRLIEMTRPGSTETSQVRAEAFVLMGRIGIADQFGTETYLEEKSISDWMKSKILEAYSLQPYRRNLILMLKYLNDPSVRLSAAAWNHLKRIFVPPLVRVLSTDESFWQPIPEHLAASAIDALRKNDLALTTNVAAFFSDSTSLATIRKAGLDSVVRAEMLVTLKRSTSSVDVEAMQALIGALGEIGNDATVKALESYLSDPDGTVAHEASKALERLTNRSYADKIVHRKKPEHVDHDWSLLERVSTKTRLIVETEKGVIELVLFSQDAPFTVVSVLKLVSKGFYDGLTFHRVVPNFVVQGGDPRGDGWGGPGYSIRTEVSERVYERGSVGIASSGKDTEGSQFFITHSPTPHLDGRYTIFAKVVKGMEVVDALQIGDGIKSVRVKW
jgi:cyclophilin family peptidyl-prolyl cis-trans isomerase/HEAT repeat protein